MDFLNEIRMAFLALKITDIIDILVMTYIIYKLIMSVKETRAAQLLKGLVVVLVFSRIAQALNLYTVNWLISNIFTVGLMIIIVVFQPELRKAFEKIGRGNSLFNFAKIRSRDYEMKTDEIANAVSSMARQKIGALIVLENESSLKEISETGTYLNAEISSELLINIFFPNSPLHDGAVIIKEEKIVAAGAILPLSDNFNISKELGTRHRAALGMSEKSDAFIIVVSEETGVVTTVYKGELSRNIDTETLKQSLNNLFVRQDESIFKKEAEEVRDGRD
ncbi:diadenylate cyclase CdaA [uncultured Helcococcus sp.]|uniref:diadenylate cyclase CdaA n=1 Tax=uncultured Helcococcus sp. TaxID=1072508 RepID=UPI0026046289|nr:diadenylate cyclase CdaA [uncultured Helcococcus sp.]